VTKITLTNVSVEIPVFDISSSSVRQMLLKKAVGGRIGSSGSHAIIDALQNVTLELNDGDRVGLIGRNGSGKTTLLRVMSKVYPPTQGEIEITGQISAMFNTTLGMSMDASGLENIRNCGMLWGLTSDQTENSIEEISEFSELGEYLAMPVRTYSAGMKMRLAFAIATALNPEILLLDEVIGVGDPSFFQKAFARIKGLIDTSRILVIASHSQPIIRQICNKAVWLQDGSLIEFGEVDHVLAAYQDKQAAV